MTLFERELAVPFGKHQIKGDLISPAAAESPCLIHLHGAGQGTRQRYRPLRLRLAQVGISSLAFDFIGHGETGGEIGESSLQSRTEQACAVIEAAGIPPSFSLLGSSMGAYNAVRLTEIYSVESLILFVPAMYAAAAYSLPFGEAFTQVIRQPQSWVESDAWNILSAFGGRLLLVTAGQDAVIPQGVIQRIYQSAVNASWREWYTVSSSSHLLIDHLVQDREEFDRVVAGIVKCVKGE